MTVVLVGWLLMAVAAPCFLAFRASYRRKGRMMLVLIGLWWTVRFVLARRRIPCRCPLWGVGRPPLERLR